MARPRRKTVLIAAAVIAVLLVGGAIALFTIPKDDKPAPDLRSEVGSGAAVPVESLSGAWSVTAGSREGEGTFAGYIVEEEFLQGARDVTAVGRTGVVSGELTVADGAVTGAHIRVDTTTLRSDEGRRDEAIRTRGLETDRFPEASFELVGPVPLPDDLADGVVSTVPVQGRLTLHGETVDVNVSVDLRPLGDEVALQARVPIRFADYGMEAPSTPAISVQDQGQLEFRINVIRSR